VEPGVGDLTKQRVRPRRFGRTCNARADVHGDEPGTAELDGAVAQGFADGLRPEDLAASGGLGERVAQRRVECVETSTDERLDVAREVGAAGAGARQLFREQRVAAG